jgi:diguanylate cyclase (GGDEF)-like protein
MNQNTAHLHADARMQQIAADAYLRSRLGAVFYLAGWILSADFGGAFDSYPILAAGVAFALSALTGIRLLNGRPAVLTSRSVLAWRDRTFALVLASAATWGALIVWMMLDQSLTGARGPAMVCTIAYATAFVHNYAMSLRLALGGAALLYLPAAVLSWWQPELRAEAILFTVYAVYLAAVAVRSKREYDSRLDLEQELREQRDRYVELSHTDALTGLANRRDFVQRLAAAIEVAVRGQRPLTLLQIDLDHFKSINDRHGHAVGDACLVYCAQLMRETFPPTATMARMGGEEFAVLLDGYDSDSARRHAEQLLARLRESAGGGTPNAVRMTASVGLAEFDAERHKLDDGFYRAVDRAMYRAKEDGRDRIIVDH